MGVEIEQKRKKKELTDNSVIIVRVRRWVEMEESIGGISGNEKNTIKNKQIFKK